MPELNQIAFWIGYGFIWIVAVAIFLWSLSGVIYLGNRVQHKLVDHFGGWKVFLEYRDWLNQRDAKPGDEEQQE